MELNNFFNAVIPFLGRYGSTETLTKCRWNKYFSKQTRKYNYLEKFMSCISVTDFNPKIWIYFTLLSFLFTGFYKLSYCCENVQKKQKRTFFCSLHQRLFLNILYITGAVRQTGRTKRIYEPPQ